MKIAGNDFINRRLFIKFLASSPLFATFGGLDNLFASIGKQGFFDSHLLKTQGDKLISSASEAINVFDFEPVAKKYYHQLTMDIWLPGSKMIEP